MIVCKKIQSQDIRTICEWMSKTYFRDAALITTYPISTFLYWKNQTGLTLWKITKKDNLHGILWITPFPILFHQKKGYIAHWNPIGSIPDSFLFSSISSIRNQSLLLMKTSQKCAHFEYIISAIPIHIEKLQTLGMVHEEECDIIPQTVSFRPVTLYDLPILFTLWKQSVSTLTLHLEITMKSAFTYLIPKKDIMYTFIHPQETDFATIYCYSNLYKGQTIQNAMLVHYACNTMTMNELIGAIMKQLIMLQIDQLIVTNFHRGNEITFTKFVLHEHFYAIHGRKRDLSIDPKLISLPIY